MFEIFYSAGTDYSEVGIALLYCRNYPKELQTEKQLFEKKLLPNTKAGELINYRSSKAATELQPAGSEGIALVGFVGNGERRS